MAEIHVYGKLRHYLKSGQNGRHGLVRLEPREDETLESLLQRLEIPVDEINHVFHNSELLATRTSMAPYMGFRQARSDLFDWDLNVPVRADDRIGLFGRDLAILGM